MTTLILPPYYSADSTSLWKAACKRGWKTQRLSVFSHRHPGYAETKAQLIADDLVFYGSDYEVRHLAAEYGYELVEPAEDWLCTLPERLTGRTIFYKHLGEILDKHEIWFPCFLKSTGDKCFPAAVYKYRNQLPPDLDPNMMVLAQQPVKFLAEWRCFISDGVLMTMDRCGQHSPDLLPMDEDAEECIADWAPKLGLSHAVVDIGVIDEGDGQQHFAIVEANPAWCSGIYGCDPYRVLDVLQGCAVKQ
jgi:hypothetical protein